ncbi:hypothetical protein GUITHDRAFT_146623 [Guillardia theta CCMP2712]|uniref:Importin N-terminal domain-containing protein n=1 Tax=Guillardia theta (strain CCMP2712) TaxID=905079 RepID=L1IG40_GUITC|nr:hypothetical protein GUITHDRAFT_146623 [Guillardia theta CCMP2712]EKX35213.1 hypothetical protein GUITHDRAFT_146623 [Guillardia theta CCMP2712]|eukprot:XP_005822193.1 hypothetical protein GUITHDRAFT_146623 [Guillardia theta CCMP2712]
MATTEGLLQCLAEGRKGSIEFNQTNKRNERREHETWIKIATSENACSCLVEVDRGTQSPIAEVRKAAEEQLQSFSREHGFGVALMEIVHSSQVDVQIRQLSAVLCRRYISNHWIRQKPDFQEPEIAEVHKAAMKQQLLNGLGLEHSKLRTAVSMAVASIAKEDFPDNWPELIPHVMSMLETGEPHLVHGAMRCLVLVSEEITDTQVPHVITHLFPKLFRIFTAVELYDKMIRARTCTVVFKCIKLISLLGDASDSEATSLQLLEQTVPAWLQCFAQVLSSPLRHDDAGELCMRIEIVKILTVIVEVYPHLLSSNLAAMIAAVWQGLTGLVEVYEVHAVYSNSSNDVEVDPADDVDGDRISIETLAWEYMECVREVVGCRHTRDLVKTQLCPIAFTLIRFMQVTVEQLQMWSEDVNAYIAHEDEGSFESSVRISAADAVTEICQSFGAEGWQAVLSAVMGQLEVASRAKAAGEEKWWLKREACMFAIAVISSDCDLQRISTIFRPDDFVRQVVLPDMSADSPAVLKGRALYCVASFARWMPLELAIQCFGPALESLGEASSLPVRMTAARAIGSLSSSGEEDEEPVLGHDFLRPHVPVLLQRIALLLASASEDSALITLEALHQIVKIHSDDVSAQLPVVLEQVLTALSRCAGDIMIASEAVETIASLVERPDAVQVVGEACTPLVMSALQHADRFVCTQVESIVELLSKIVRRVPGQDVFRGPLLDVVFPTLLTIMRTTENEDIIQPGCACLRSYLREAQPELARLQLQGQPVIPDCYYEIVIQILSVGSEGSVTALAPLIEQMFLRCRGAVQHLIPNMLAAALEQLRAARTLQLKQAIVVLFARLLVEDLEATLGFLKEHRLEGGQEALPVLLVCWAKEHGDFSGSYECKVLTAALGSLLLSGDMAVLNMSVPGQRKENSEQRRLTRSQTRNMAENPIDQWTAVPFALKAFLLLLETIKREEEEERSFEGDCVSDEGASADAEGDDFDEGDGDGASRGKGKFPHMSPHLSALSDDGGALANGIQSEACRREIVKTIMAGMHKLRGEDVDRDHQEDPISNVNIKDKCLEVLQTLAQHQRQKLRSCLERTPAALQSVAMAHLGPMIAAQPMH